MSKPLTFSKVDLHKSGCIKKHLSIIANAFVIDSMSDCNVLKTFTIASNSNTSLSSLLHNMSATSYASEQASVALLIIKKASFFYRVSTDFGTRCLST